MAEKKESGSGVVPFIPSEINIYPKSNFLIGSKYKSTLLENKIMAYSLANADKFDSGTSNSERETIQSVIPVSELLSAAGCGGQEHDRQIHRHVVAGQQAF